MSQTEREALEAGTVGWDGELFSGRPAWDQLLARAARPQLTAEEQHFLDHEVETLCAMVSDWETTNVHKDLPPHVWQYIKDHGFLGMIIPKAFGGLGFSRLRAFAGDHEAVDAQRHRRGDGAGAQFARPGRTAAATTAPTSRSATTCRASRAAHEIPCFALTSPQAGSDAAVDSRLGRRLLRRARRQARARLARHLGQALHHARAGRDAARPRVSRVRPRAPRRRARGSRHHLRADSDDASGRRTSAGATCRSTRCSRTARTPAHDVFIPMDWVIGGAPMLGKGWRMLMECLAAGRGISLPSSNTGMAQARRAHDGRVRARAHAVQDADRHASRASRKR